MSPLRFALSFSLSVAGVALVAAPAPATRVAVFDNPSYVDTRSRNTQAESDAIQASLAWLGHRVSTFTEIDATALQSSIGGSSVVVIPELENRDLAAALSETALDLLRRFVNRGGDLIVHGTSDQRAPRLINALFGWHITSGTVGAATIGPDAEGTPFAEAPSRINANQRTRGLDLANLPDSAEALYINRTRAPVVQFLQGAGRVLYLGWDWYQAAPLGDRDGGWLRVLAAAVGDEAPCRDGGGVDRDGDGIIDNCTEEPEEEGCATFDTRRQTPRGTWIELSQPRSEVFHDIFFNGVFKLPARTSFAEIDPRKVPFVFSVLGKDGRPQFTQTLPTTRARASGRLGWRFSARDAKWVFEDPSGNTANGFVRVVAKDLSPDSPGRVRFRAIGQGGNYPVAPTEGPISIMIAVGDSDRGQCAEATFTKSQCFVENNSRSLSCRY